MTSPGSMPLGGIFRHTDRIEDLKNTESSAGRAATSQLVHGLVGGIQFLVLVELRALLPHHPLARELPQFLGTWDFCTGVARTSLFLT